MAGGELDGDLLDEVGEEVVCEVARLEGFVFPEGSVGGVEGLFWTVVPADSDALLILLRTDK